MTSLLVYFAVAYASVSIGSALAKATAKKIREEQR